jgi:hypothetical protein
MTFPLIIFAILIIGALTACAVAAVALLLMLVNDWRQRRLW